MGRVSIRETLIVLAILLIAGIGTVIALSRDGAPPVRWRVDLGAPVTAGPSLSAGLIFTGSERGQIVALDADDGTERWRASLDATPRGRIQAATSVIAFRTDRGDVIALDASTGVEAWRVSPPDGVNTPLVEDGTVIVATRDGEIIALDAATGIQRWRTSTGRTLRADPALGGGAHEIIVTGDIGGRLTRVTFETGELLDEIELGGEFAGPILWTNGLLIGGPRSGLVTLDSNGGERWRRSAGQPTRLPMVERDGVLYADASPDLLALDLVTGDLLWRYTSRAFVVTFGIGDGLAIAGTHTGEVHGIDLTTGERQWRFRTNDSIRGAPIVDEAIGVAYFGSLDGWVYAIELRADQESDQE